MIKQNILKQLKRIVYILLPLVGGGLVGVSCSEEDATEDEYANWQQRNDVFFASLADSLRLDQANWQRLKKYSLDQNSEGAATDYVYVKVLGRSNEEGCPNFTDSVRVSYQGRLIPTTTYPEGNIFDGTVYGTYSDKTNSTRKFLLSSTTMIDGFCTALQHMHKGDHWRVYIPSELGYGETGSGTTIPGHSVLIFEMTLVDYSPAGQAMPAWSARLK